MLIRALPVITTAGNVNNVAQTLPLVDAVPPVAGRVGHPRKRPDALLGDKGYDSRAVRRELRHPARHQPDIYGLGKLRYVVEQAFALLHHFKRLAVRWEQRLDLHDALVTLGCTIICWRRLKKARR